LDVPTKTPKHWGVNGVFTMGTPPPTVGKITWNVKRVDDQLLPLESYAHKSQYPGGFWFAMCITVLAQKVHDRSGLTIDGSSLFKDECIHNRHDQTSSKCRLDEKPQEAPVEAKQIPAMAALPGFSTTSTKVTRCPHATRDIRATKLCVIRKRYIHLFDLQSDICIPIHPDSKPLLVFS